MRTSAATEGSSSRRTPKRSATRPRERAPAAGVVVRKSSVQGRGVYATQDFEPEDVIVEYLGERISQEKAGERYDDESVRRHHTFLFSVDDEICIDASRDGNEARFINHSCEPNAYALVKSRRIFILAQRPIAAGEEIFYDYWFSTDPDYTLEQLRRIYPCLCGAKKCRGTLAAPPKKPRAKASKRRTKRTGSR